MHLILKVVAEDDLEDLETVPGLGLVDFLKIRDHVEQFVLDNPEGRLAAAASQNRCLLQSAKSSLDGWCTSFGYQSNHQDTAVGKAA